MKTIPHSIEAEEAVIGSLLLGADIKLLDLVPEDFYSEQCRLIYGACQSVEKINEITVAHSLGKNLDRAGGAHQLSHLISVTPTPYDCEHYAKVVKELSIKRQLISASDKISSLSYEKNPEEILSEVESVFSDIRAKSESLNDLIDPLKLSDYVLNVTTERTDPGISWGFQTINDMNGGLYPGEVYVIGARPSIGKSQLIQQVAMNVANCQRKVLFISIEMSLRMLIDREIAMFTGLSMFDIRRRDLKEEQWGLVAELAGVISERSLYYLCGNRTTENISVISERMKASQGLDLIIIDYLQLMKDCQNTKFGATKDNRVGYVSSRIKQLAVGIDVPIILASQLNRASEVREDNQPTLADLRDSGCIEQDADCVMLLHRDRKDGEGGTLQIYQAKGRQTGRGLCDLKWNEQRRKYI